MGTVRAQAFFCGSFRRQLLRASSQLCRLHQPATQEQNNLYTITIVGFVKLFIRGLLLEWFVALELLVCSSEKCTRSVDAGDHKKLDLRGSVETK